MIGSVVLVVVLAFAFWYELQSHALGPAGRREIVQVTSGESMDSIAGQLSAHHVIGSTLAFRLFDLVHGTPTVTPGDYALHENETFAQVRAALAAGPNIYVVTVLSGLTLAEVATHVDGLPGHAPGGFTREAASGAVRSAFSAPGPTSSYPARATPPCSPTWCAASTPRPPRPA
jgi:cell division protein YceG involved in septum cleavage